jgi:hypothetical protein
VITPDSGANFIVKVMPGTKARAGQQLPNHPFKAKPGAPVAE